MLDMVVLGQILAFTCMDDVVGPSHKHSAHQRQMSRARFMHAGKRVCRETFLALHAIGIHNNKQHKHCIIVIIFREDTFPGPEEPFHQHGPGVKAAWESQETATKLPHL